MLVWMFVVLMLRVYCSLTWQFTLLLFFWLSVSDILIWMICLLTWRRVPEFKWSLHQHNQFCEASHRHNLLLRILFDCCNTSLRTALKGIKFYTSLSLSSVTETTVNSSLDRELSYLNVWFFCFFVFSLLFVPLGSRLFSPRPQEAQVRAEVGFKSNQACECVWWCVKES